MRGMGRVLRWGLLAWCLISTSGCALLLLPMAAGGGWGVGKETDEVMKALKKSPDDGAKHEEVVDTGKPSPARVSR